MRYSKEHKSETRKRILQAAGPLLRGHGVDKVSIDELMSAAGLTRGAFYAHFESKEELVAEALATDTGLVRMMKDRSGDSTAELNRQALDILSDYMAPRNSDEVASGCPLVSMPCETARGPASLKRGYARRFAELVRQIQRGLGRSRKHESEAIAAAVLAVGGVLFARACDDPDLAKRISTACRQHVEGLLRDRPR